MTDRYPNIFEEFYFDQGGKRHSKFYSRYTDSNGVSRKVGLARDGEITAEEREKIYAEIDAFIKAEQKEHSSERVIPS